MGWWTDRILPHMVDRVCGVGALRGYRERGCAGLHGAVLEIGFGSGLNVPHYPAAVEHVSAVEPSDVAWAMAQRRLGRTATAVARTGLDGEALDADDAAYDAALSTFTLCTIPDLDAALGEVRRVLKPGGALHFVEHGLSPHERVARWQRRLQPLHGRVAGGCRLDRPIATFLERGGFEVERLERSYIGAPNPFGYLYVGTART